MLLERSQMYLYSSIGLVSILQLDLVLDINYIMKFDRIVLASSLFFSFVTPEEVVLDTPGVLISPLTHNSEINDLEAEEDEGFHILRRDEGGFEGDRNHVFKRSQRRSFFDLEKNDLLRLHNEKRRLHVDTPPLTWSDKLADYAAAYADSLVGTDYDPCSLNLRHSNGPYGENIGAIIRPFESDIATSRDIVFAWYDEIKDYDFLDITGTRRNGRLVGHFTQMIWAATEKVGCTLLYCPADSRFGKTLTLYILCSYEPAGNVVMAANAPDRFLRYRQNVKRLKVL
ncbi:HCL639Cp [Eremothecium sinecaudum]|uniref:HCL639Cp n=1 Tax=Eremothecium sinecaudum TaxID=45286 RepID=A0A109UY97_9SACH|nr:HCL639Cp [Eremothecium sinecaudum]AMD19512.1 HCL639Cp [Eremothecium sinecaudum]